ncbi:MAG TPA: hypothetical protein VGN23_12800 [Verrucomicrobiae bacterium]|jgi:hypothetical protein
MDENENFESLRRLMALKRHEVPPPGYFHNFSSEVIARIKLGEHRSAEAAETPWFLRLLQIFDAKPAFAGVFASSLCLLLVFGIVNAERPDMPVAQSPMLIQTADNNASAANPPATVSQTSQSAQSTLALNSTNPILDLQATAQQAVPVNELFNQGGPSVQDASFTPPGQ